MSQTLKNKSFVTGGNRASEPPSSNARPVTRNERSRHPLGKRKGQPTAAKMKRDRSVFKGRCLFYGDCILLLQHCCLLCYCPRQADAFPSGQGRRSRVLPLRFQGGRAPLHFPYLRSWLG